MDNYIDHLGESDDDEQRPDNDPEYTPPTVEPEDSFPTVEPVETPDDSAFTEPRYEPEPPPVPESADPFVMPPLPEGPSKDDKLWATFCHLAAFSTYMIGPIGAILGPLVVWLIKRDDSPFVDENGKKALNFQISILIYSLAATPLICVLPVYVILVICLGILDMVFTIVAAIKANNGEEVSYPISIEFIK
jgi:uncharacterized Tic20 family protein